MPSPTDARSHSLPDPEPESSQSPTSAEGGDYVTVSRRREDLEDAPFWKEVEAFNRIPQSLIDHHYGQYVAVYQGNIVDSDPDEGELAFRFYRTFGYVPVYIHKVGIEDGLVDTDDSD